MYLLLGLFDYMSITSAEVFGQDTRFLKLDLDPLSFPVFRLDHKSPPVTGLLRK